MKDRAKAIAAGLVQPAPQSCLLCHNKESPSFKGLKYAEMVKKIEHKNPSKKSK